MTCATVTALVPAGQVLQTTLTTVDAAGDVPVAVTVTAGVACAATDWATLTPDTLAMLAMEVAMEAGQVMTCELWPAGQVGQGTVTVVMAGAGGAGMTWLWQVRQMGGW